MNKLTLLIVACLSSIGILTGQSAFITTWQTTADNESVTIPTTGPGYDYEVDWGDGHVTNGHAGNVSHNYNIAGTYQISITGDFPRIYFAGSAFSRYKIYSIDQWGDQIWVSMNRAFEDCSNLIINATDVPDLSQATSCSLMFLRASSIISGLENWDVSNITNMNGMFSIATSFNDDLSNWDVSNVTTMASMFDWAWSFNSDLSNWDVSNVTSMASMFNNANSFNRDLSNWDVSNVTDMSGMFKETDLFNKDIGGWDVSQVKWMDHMFDSAIKFNQDLDDWDVSQVKWMDHMFEDANKFNGEIGSWDVSQVTEMGYMFENARSFNQSLENWDVSQLSNMEHMFDNANAFNQDLNNWDVSGVFNMSHLFNSTNVFNGDITNWDVSNVTIMTSMFEGAFQFNQDIGDWDVSNVNYMEYMLRNTLAFDQNIGDWDVTSLIDGRKMLLNTNLSTENYDAMLIGWASQDVNCCMSQFWLGETTYCEGEDARDFLIEEKNWAITDGGEECPTCDDGVQNGDEIGIDCGGSMCPSCTECISTDFNDAESGLGIWIDGGDDAAISNNVSYANSGTHSFLIKDNTNTSVITTVELDLSNYDSLIIGFNFIATGFNNNVQDFWLQVSIDGGATFVTVADWIYTEDFDNDLRVFENVNIAGPFSSGTQLRFRCDATGNNDKVYIDDVLIEACGLGAEPTCDDGIQNGDETGVDCGGSNCAPCSPCSDLDFNDAELGWGIWNDGGADAARVNNATFSNSGTFSLLIKDNTSTSNITTDNIDLSIYDQLIVDFNFIPTGFNNATQDFWLQLSTDGGVTFTTIHDWVFTEDFENNIRVFENVMIEGPFTDQTQLRFQCDATGNNDKVYIDDILVEACMTSSANSETQSENRTLASVFDFVVYPNPTIEAGEIRFNINSPAETVNLRVIDIVGQVIVNRQIQKESYNAVNLTDLNIKSGTYFISITDGEKAKVKRIIVID